MMLPRHAGFTLHAVPELERRPFLERDTFSGGVNLSARERNSKRRADAAKVYVMGDRIIGSPSIIGQLELQLAKEFPEPVTSRDLDDVIDDLYAELHSLNESHPDYQKFYDELSARILATEEKRAIEMSEYFEARNPMPDQAELNELLAKVDMALGRRT